MRRAIKYLVILLIITTAPTYHCFAANDSNEKLSWEEFYPQPYEYPDDVGGLYYDRETGKDYYLVIDPTPERLEELRTILSGSGSRVGISYYDPMNLPENIDELRAQYRDSINFTSPCKYSYTELMRVNYEMYLLMGPDSSIYGAGLGWSNSNGVLTGFGETGKELRVIVSVAEKEVNRYSSEFTEKYGDMVVVEAGSHSFPTAPDSDMGENQIGSGYAIEETGGRTGLHGNTLWTLIIVGSVVLIALIAVIWWWICRRSRRNTSESV